MTKRVYGLDILRAFAILTVLYSHAGRIFNTQLPFQIDGVNVFFVLSGFLIGTILLKTFQGTHVTLKLLSNFWVRRWMRTLPAYICVLLILILFAYNGNPTVAFVPYFFFIQNIFRGRLQFFAESWSLSIEEWFYLLIPVMLAALIRVRKFDANLMYKFSIVCLIAGFTIKLAACLYYKPVGYDMFDTYIRQVIVMRLDSIMIGVICAALKFFKSGLFSRHKRIMFAIGICLYIICTLGNVITWPVLLMKMYLGGIATFLVIPALSEFKTGRGMLYSFITFTSIISYSLYLLNLSMFEITRHYTWHTVRKIARTQHWEILTTNKVYPWIEFASYLIFCFGGAFLLYRYVEKPFMKFRDKITAEKS